jgi:AraC family transcriptional regulator
MASIDDLSKSHLPIGVDQAVGLYIYPSLDVSIGTIGAMAMAYQDIQVTQAVDLPHEAHLRDFSAGKVAMTTISARRSREWVGRVLLLLEEAARQLQPSEGLAHGRVLEATSLLRKHINPGQELPDANGRLLAWQARKVLHYIDSHIAGPVAVADLCALIGRSEAHFSRSFKRTFGESPHAFVIRCRVELAARYMLQTDASLSQIAHRCGFTDQAHLCKHFRQSIGQTPAAWRRTLRTQDSGESMADRSSEGVFVRSVRSDHGLRP